MLHMHIVCNYLHISGSMVRSYFDPIYRDDPPKNGGQYKQYTLQRLAKLCPEGERDGPKLPDCSSVFYIIIILLLFLIRCNSQTTELTQTRIQIAPPILVPLRIKEDTQHVRLEFPISVLFHQSSLYPIKIF